MSLRFVVSVAQGIARISFANKNYRWIGVAFGVAASLPAAAQEATVIDRLDPAPAGDAFVVAKEGRVDGELKASFAVGLGYAHRPLTLVDLASDEEFRAVVEHQLNLYGMASLALFDRVLLEVAVPATLYQSGEPATARSSGFGVPGAQSLGDVRVSGRAELLEQTPCTPSVGFAMSVHAPTGDPTRYTGTGETRFTPRLSISADYGPFLWALSGFRTFEPAARSLDAPASGGSPTFNLLGDEMGAELGVAARVAWAQLGVEAVATTHVGRVTPYESSSDMRLEVLGSAKGVWGPVSLSILGGPGVLSMPGTPAFRVFTSLGVTFETLSSSSGEKETADASPQPGGEPSEPVVVPTQPGEKPAANPAGKPGEKPAAKPVPAKLPAPPPIVLPKAPKPKPDRDGDGVFDEVDACVDVAGIKHPDPKRSGCPLDTDEDGIVDTLDACPNEAGTADAANPKRHGCSAGVQVEAGRFVVLENIRFESGKANLLPESDKILEQIRRSLEGDSTIARVAVDGHTDGSGAPAANLELSRARAVAVVNWLVTRGVDSRRLMARGFGSRQPIANDLTPDGKSKNRRVEFIILRRDPLGKAGWTDGVIEAVEAKKP